MLIKLIIFFAIIEIGCTEELGLYLDSDCTESEQSLIHIAVDRLNTVAGSKIVEIAGIKARPSDPLNDDTDMISCYDSGGGEETAAKTIHFDIFLYRDALVKDDLFVSAVMHEIVHYIVNGIDTSTVSDDTSDHIFDEGCVMNPYLVNPPITEYCERDVDLISLAF